MDGNLENAVNEMNRLLLPFLTTLVLIVGILTICYGIYKLSQKNKVLGLKYIGMGVGVFDSSLILYLLLVLNDKIKNFLKMDNAILLQSLVAIILFITSFILVYKSGQLIEIQEKER